jgi:ABC-type protease/lipase transport system fused ATPase/permease subunit
MQSPRSPRFPNARLQRASYFGAIVHSSSTSCRVRMKPCGTSCCRDCWRAAEPAQLAFQIMKFLSGIEGLQIKARDRMTTQAVLEATSIGLRYPGESRAVLETFDFTLEAGEIVSILGPSGVGKSSGLLVLGGLQRPTDGTVGMNGTPLHGVHPRVGIAFQDPSLLPWLSLEKNQFPRPVGCDFSSC